MADCRINVLPGKNVISFDDYWPVFQPIISKLVHQEAVTKVKWRDLFWFVNDVCLWHEGHHTIYNYLKEKISEFIRKVQLNILAHQEDNALLKAYIAEWRKFFIQCTYLPLPFVELDKTLAEKSASDEEKDKKLKESVVQRMMFDFWDQNIFSSIKQRLLNSAMKLVDSERKGEAFDSQLVIGVRESFVYLCTNSDDRLQSYHENIEKPYIAATEAFYRVKAPEYFEANGVHNYMCYADQKLKEEEQMGLKYLVPCPGSIQALNECCAQCLISVFKEPILAECPGFIRNNETERLKTMLKIMDHVPEGISSMQKDLEQHIIQQGQAVMFFKAAQAITNCVRHSEQLLDLFAKYNKLVKEAFNDDPRFLTSRDKVFTQIANETSSYCLELFLKQQSVGNETQPESCYAILLSHYCDLLLKKTSVSKKLTSDQIESRLKNVILVLKYIQNKDVFMKYYKCHLTRRLILESSVDNEKEENMVEWLRDIFMPTEYVDKLARMLQDIKVSEDLNQQFKNSHIHKGTFADMNIKILNAVAWARGTQRVQVSLPLELEQFIPELEDYYKQKHNGRKLLWNHHMSNGTITFSNKAGKFDLDVTTFQIAVLFAWNERPYDRISFEDLRLATELPDAELRRTLWSLVNFPKLKSQVLLYGPEVKTPKEFGDSTQFWINQEFSVMKNNKLQNRRKLNLVGRLQLYTEKSTEEDGKSIAQLRNLRTQEAIIKIMKMRRKITFASLQTELVQILKNMFLPSKVMIKEQIEWLMERDYIKSDEENRNVLIYMA